MTNANLLLQVAEVFTGSAGKLVPLAETIKGFKMILDGKLCNLPMVIILNFNIVWV